MPKSVLKDTLALAVYRSVSARMAPSAMWNLARATVNQVGMEHTVKNHAQMVTGELRVMKCVIVRKTAQNVIRKTAPANAARVILANNVMSSVRRVLSAVTAPNCVSVARAVQAVILSRAVVCVSLVITGRRAIKSVLLGNGVTTARNIVIVATAAHATLPLVRVDARPTGWDKSVNCRVKMDTLA